MDISATNKSHSFNYTITKNYNLTKNKKQFNFDIDKYNADNFKYLFQVTLKSCNGLYGVKSEQFECQQSESIK